MNSKNLTGPMPEALHLTVGGYGVNQPRRGSKPACSGWPVQVTPLPAVALDGDTLRVCVGGAGRGGLRVLLSSEVPPSDHARALRLVADLVEGQGEAMLAAGKAELFLNVCGDAVFVGD